MDETILVPLNNRQQIDQVLPVLDTIAKPGLRIVFLILQYQGNPQWIAGYWGFVRTGMETVFSAYINGQGDRAWVEERLAQEKLTRWQRELCPKGVEIEITICRDGIRPVIESAKRDGRVKLIMTPVMTASPFRRLVEQLSRAFGLLRVDGRASAVMLRHI
jgi:hypothetical protein